MRPAVLFFLLLLFVFQSPFAQSKSCSGIFAKKSVELKTVDELLLHVYFVSQVAPHRINDLAEIGISPQTVGGVQRLFRTLARLQEANNEMSDLSAIITAASTSVEEVAEYQAWQQDIQLQVRQLRQEYETQKDKLIRFIKVHNAYPKFNGVLVDIVHIEGPNQSEKFVHKVKEIYEAFSLNEGWAVKNLIDKTNHAKILIRSEQALAHLIGETGVQTWNTVHSEFGDNGAYLRADGGKQEKRRMAKVRVEVLPHVAFSYRMNINDVKIEQFNSAAGNGGQKRNKTSSDVRAIHIPSGISVEAMEHRSAADNRREALKFLELEVVNFYRQDHEAKVRESFQTIQGINGDQITRSFHLKENRITGLNSTKFSTRANTLDQLDVQEVFPSIYANGRASFETSNIERISDALGRVMALEREVLEESSGGFDYQYILNEADTLSRLGIQW